MVRITFAEVINETIRRIKEKQNCQGLMKDVEQFVKNARYIRKRKLVGEILTDH